MKLHKPLNFSFCIFAMLQASVGWGSSCQDQCLPYCCFMTMLPETCVGSPVCPNLAEKPVVIFAPVEGEPVLDAQLEAAVASKRAAADAAR